MDNPFDIMGWGETSTMCPMESPFLNAHMIKKYIDILRQWIKAMKDHIRSKTGVLLWQTSLSPCFFVGSKSHFSLIFVWLKALFLFMFVGPKINFSLLCGRPKGHVPPFDGGGGGGKTKCPISYHFWETKIPISSQFTAI